MVGLRWRIPLDFGRVASLPGEPRQSGNGIHSGIDFGSYRGPNGEESIAGADVKAAADGVIRTAIGRLDNDRRGRRVVIAHADGSETHYYHLASLAPRLREGMLVKMGDLIGKVGSSGVTEDAYIPHLHYERRRTLSQTVIAPFGDARLNEKLGVQ